MKVSPIDVVENPSIFNVYQSYWDDGLSISVAKEETARRLRFEGKNIANTVKEMLSGNDIQSNSTLRMKPNAYKKLSEEEVEDISRLIHENACICNVKRISKYN